MKNKQTKIKVSNKYKLKYFFSYTLWTPFRCIKNFFFCLKYPFWKAYNVWNDKFVGYKFTEYDAIPEGWRKAFGRQLSEELRKVVKDELKKIWHNEHKRLKVRDIIKFSQIKEKYGMLCLYATTTAKIFDILHKYEQLSKYYCIHCGEKAEYCATGWVLYLCENCFMDYLCSENFSSDKELLDYMQEHKIVESENEE